jgi:hypothetical protein
LANRPAVWITAENRNRNQFAENLFSQDLTGSGTVGLANFRGIDTSEANLLLPAVGIEAGCGIPVCHPDTSPPDDLCCGSLTG